MMFDQIVSLVVFGVLLLIGVSTGGVQERRHFRSLARRERALSHVRLDNRKRVDAPDTIANATLVMGQVVIATDYFKTFATQLRNLVGGEMVGAQRLLTRARREALLRMQESAVTLGATEVWNVRFEFCNVSQMRGRAGAMQVEMVAYGTAVIRRP